MSLSPALSPVFGLPRYFKFIGDVLSAPLLFDDGSRRVLAWEGEGGVTVTVFLSASTKGGGRCTRGIR